MTRVRIHVSGFREGVAADEAADIASRLVKLVKLATASSVEAVRDATTNAFKGFVYVTMDGPSGGVDADAPPPPPTTSVEVTSDEGAAPMPVLVAAPAPPTSPFQRQVAAACKMLQGLSWKGSRLKVETARPDNNPFRCCHVPAPVPPASPSFNDQEAAPATTSPGGGGGGDVLRIRRRRGQLKVRVVTAPHGPSMVGDPDAVSEGGGAQTASVGEHGTWSSFHAASGAEGDGWQPTPAIWSRRGLSNRVHPQTVADAAERQAIGLLDDVIGQGGDDSDGEDGSSDGSVHMSAARRAWVETHLLRRGRSSTRVCGAEQGGPVHNGVSDPHWSWFMAEDDEGGTGAGGGGAWLSDSDDDDSGDEGDGDGDDSLGTGKAGRAASAVAAAGGGRAVSRPTTLLDEERSRSLALLAALEGDGEDGRGDANGSHARLAAWSSGVGLIAKAGKGAQVGSTKRAAPSRSAGGVVVFDDDDVVMVPPVPTVQGASAQAAMVPTSTTQQEGRLGDGGEGDPVARAAAPVPMAMTRKVVTGKVEGEGEDDASSADSSSTSSSCAAPSPPPASTTRVGAKRSRVAEASLPPPTPAPAPAPAPVPASAPPPPDPHAHMQAWDMLASLDALLAGAPTPPAAPQLPPATTHRATRTVTPLPERRVDHERGGPVDHGRAPVQGRQVEAKPPPPSTHSKPAAAAPPPAPTAPTTSEKQAEAWGMLASLDALLTGKPAPVATTHRRAGAPTAPGLSHTERVPEAASTRAPPPPAKRRRADAPTSEGGRHQDDGVAPPTMAQATAAPAATRASAPPSSTSRDGPIAVVNASWREVVYGQHHTALSAKAMARQGGKHSSGVAVGGGGDTKAAAPAPIVMQPFTGVRVPHMDSGFKISDLFAAHLPPEVATPSLPPSLPAPIILAGGSIATSPPAPAVSKPGAPSSATGGSAAALRSLPATGAQPSPLPPPTPLSPAQIAAAAASFGAFQPRSKGSGSAVDREDAAAKAAKRREWLKGDYRLKMKHAHRAAAKAAVGSTNPSDGSGADRHGKGGSRSSGATKRGGGSRLRK